MDAVSDSNCCHEPSLLSSPTFLISFTFMVSPLVPYSTIFCTRVVSSSPWLSSMKMLSLLTPWNFTNLRAQHAPAQRPPLWCHAVGQSSMTMLSLLTPWNFTNLRAHHAADQRAIAAPQKAVQRACVEHHALCASRA